VSDLETFRKRIVQMHKEFGNWTDYRSRFGLLPEDEIDFHLGRRDPHLRYEEAMSEIEERVLNSLQRAYERGRPYIMFTHGWHTSRPGKTTARSVVRRVMRSKEATPYILRSECIQHPAVFVVKIRAKHRAAENGAPLFASQSGSQLIMT
jgi:hypothetical protein